MLARNKDSPRSCAAKDFIRLEKVEAQAHKVRRFVALVQKAYGGALGSREGHKTGCVACKVVCTCSCSDRLCEISCGSALCARCTPAGSLSTIALMDRPTESSNSTALRCPCRPPEVSQLKMALFRISEGRRDMFVGACVRTGVMNT